MDIHFSLADADFVWDADKAARNIKKHGIRFEEAVTVFSDPFFRLVDASRNDEARDAVIGFSGEQRLLFVVHVQVADDCIRIISARKATKEERRDHDHF
jgi:uncharacterized DUF497 family protein